MKSKKKAPRRGKPRDLKRLVFIIGTTQYTIVPVVPAVYMWSAPQRR